MNRLYIIITDFNGYIQTQRCLESLELSHFKGFYVIVVDHGTTDETSIGLGVRFPEVKYLRGSPELWWAGSNNMGIRYALECGADRIMLLNNDCYVMPDTVGSLVELTQIKPDAVIAPIQQSWCSGEIIAISPRTCFLLGFSNLAGPLKLTSKMVAKKLQPVNLINGGRGVIIPAEVFRKIGLFDQENLPHYGADHDFYLRIRRQGIRLYVATHIFVAIDNSRTTLAHKLGRLSGADFFQTLKNIRSHRNLRDVTRLFCKHYPIPYLYPVGIVLFVVRYVVIYLLKRGYFLIKKSVK